MSPGRKTQAKVRVLVKESHPAKFPIDGKF